MGGVMGEQSSHVPALRKRGRPTAAERRRRENEILNSALGVFLRTGYGACTVDELAAASQVTKRTLYAYYGDKAEVFAAMVRHLAAAVSLDAASDRDTLETLAARIVSRVHSDELVGLHQLVIAESTRFPELALILHSSGDARHVARLAEHIRAERGAGLRRQQAFGMRGAVMIRHVAILGLDQHVAIGIDQNGAERMVAVGRGAAGDLERPPQKMFVDFGDRHFQTLTHFRFVPEPSL